MTRLQFCTLSTVVLLVGIGCSGSGTASSGGSGTVTSTGSSGSSTSSTGSTSSSSGTSSTASSSSSGSTTGGNPVFGTDIDTFVGSSADAGATQVLSKLEDIEPLFQYLPVGNDGYSKLPGVLLDAGLFELPDVPTGSTYLIQASNDYIVTTSRVPDLGLPGLGRFDALALSSHAPLAVDFDLTGMQPLDASGFVELLALNDGFANFTLQNSLKAADGTPVFNPGDTELKGTGDWTRLNQINNPTGVDPARGDTIFVGQLVVQDGGDDGATQVKPLVGFADFTGTSIFPTGDNALISPMTNLVPTTPVTITIPRTVTDSSELATGATLRDAEFNVSVLPGADQYGFYDSSVDLLFVTSSASVTSDFVVSTAYADPYPVEWPQLAIANLNYTVPLTVDPREGGTIQVAIGYQYVDLIGNLRATYTPKIGVPRDIQVNGMSALGNVSGVGTTPTVSWQAPAVGTPTAYELRLVEASYDTTSASTVATPLAYVTVPASTTNFTFPSGLMDGVHDYYVLVEALDMPGVDLTTSPFRSSLPVDTAINMTGLLLP